MYKIIFMCTVTLFSILTLTSHADIYKFKDSEGVIHYTNIPQGRNYSKVMSERKSTPGNKYIYIIREKSRKYNIEPSIIKAVITAESNWNPRALSHKGAIGLMQLMPSTARDMQITNPYDPEQNIEAGTRYLRFLLNRFDGDMTLALAAYNAGLGKVERSGGVPAITETKKYIKKIISISKGKSYTKTNRIYKVIFDDGTTLYTNTPPTKKHFKIQSKSNLAF
ncbi:MAG: lytic transglycosylase domain-containing protein [Nitrospirota bacterium]